MDENFFTPMLAMQQEELKKFYAPYFTKESDLNNFLFDAFDYEYGSLSKRQMLYQVQRFVSLANDIDKLRPGRDCLRMLFIKFCLESLCSLSGHTNKQKSQFYAKFIGCFSEQGKQYILSNFVLSGFEDVYCGHVYEAHHNLTLEDFFEIIKVTRDMVVHEGIYWEMQFFAHDNDSTWIATIETKEKPLKSYTYHSNVKREITYYFETTLKYEQFIFHFVEACVRFIEKS